MWITQLELRNIKSYGPSTRINFAPGVNAITGPNGAGKSTILEAIGLVLFDAVPHTQKQFVREEAKRGEIAVSFVDALDEREYQVVRPVRGGTPYVYDPQIRRRTVTGKQNVLDWLHEHLGVDPSAHLKSLFDDAIGVPQGTLTAPFLENTRVRKAKFDLLLQVDDYETAWEKLRETLSYVRDQNDDIAKRIAGLQGKLEALPNLEKDAEALRDQVKADAEKQADITDRLVRAEADLDKLDALQARIDALSGELKEREAQLDALARRLSDARDAVREAQEAEDIVQQAEPGYQAYQTAQDRLDKLETQRHERDELRGELSRIERDLALVAQAIENHRQTLTDIARAEERLAEIQPLVAQQTKLETERQEAEKDAERWRDAQARLQEEQARVETLHARLSQVQAKLKTRRALEAEVASLSAQREKIDEELAGLEAQLSDLETALTQASADLDAARQAVSELEQAERWLTEEEKRLSALQSELEQVRAGLRQRQQTQATLTDLEQQRQQKEQERTALSKKEASLQTQRQMLSERLKVLEQADQAACPVCQQSLTAERADELADHYRAESADLDGRLQAIQGEIANIEASAQALQTQIAQHQERLAQMPSLARERELSTAVTARQDAVEEWQQRVRSLAGAKDRLQACRERHQEMTKQRDALQAHRRAQSQERDKIDREIAAVQARIADLPHPNRERELQNEIETQRQRMGEQRRRVESLSGATERVEALQEKLAALGDPRGEQSRLQAEVEKRPQVEESLAEAQTRRQTLESSQTEVTTSLQAYARLDTEVNEQRAVLDQHEADYHRYLQHQQIALALPDRQHKVAELEDESRNLESQREQIRRDLDAVQAKYDQDRHQDLAAERQNLERQKAALTERLRSNRDRLQQVESQLGELYRLQEQRVAAEEEQKTLAALRETLTFIRQTIREAGPHITRALVQTISAEANRIFGDILNDYTMHLRWGEDYSITVERQGNERDFSQLSGGEKVVAALAVRLALLREMSDIRIAFFDEPTAHLDDERRDNLAEQITQIKGFQQLFVISHDDTFERETHHVLRVSKENGVSQVEVG